MTPYIPFPMLGISRLSKRIRKSLCDAQGTAYQLRKVYFGQASAARTKPKPKKSSEFEPRLGEITSAGTFRVFGCLRMVPKLIKTLLTTKTASLALLRIRVTTPYVFSFCVCSRSGVS
jgi:hypothetical protein